MVKSWKGGRTSAKVPGKPGWEENSQECVWRGEGTWKSALSEIPSVKVCWNLVLKVFKVSTTRACDSTPQQTEFPKFPLHLSELNCADTSSQFFPFETRNLITFWAADGSSREAVTREGPVSSDLAEEQHENSEVLFLCWHLKDPHCQLQLAAVREHYPQQDLQKHTPSMILKFLALQICAKLEDRDFMLPTAVTSSRVSS